MVSFGGGGGACYPAGAGPTGRQEGSLGITATGTAVLQSGVASVMVTNGGSGYTSAPTVTFAAVPSGGVLRIGVASVRVTNRGQRLHVCPNRDLFGPGHR